VFMLTQIPKFFLEWWLKRSVFIDNVWSRIFGVASISTVTSFFTHPLIITHERQITSAYHALQQVNGKSPGHHYGNNSLETLDTLLDMKMKHGDNEYERGILATFILGLLYKTCVNFVDELVDNPCEIV